MRGQIAATFRTQGQEFSVLSPLVWRLGDLGAKQALLKERLGWGNMPRHMVANDLVEGFMLELDLPEKPGAIIRCLRCGGEPLGRVGQQAG